MDRYYNLKDEQARAMIGAKTGLFVTPLRKQPENVLIFEGKERPCFLSSNYCQFPVGSRVGLRETWWTRREYMEDAPEPEYRYCGPFWYKADEGNNPKNEYHWRSPVIMPVAAIRHWGTVIDDRVCRVNDIPQSQMREIIPILPPETSSMTHRDWNRWYALNRSSEIEQWYNTTFGRRKGFIPFESNPWVEVAVWEREKI